MRLSFLAAWMDLEVTILNETSHVQKDTTCSHSLAFDSPSSYRAESLAKHLGGGRVYVSTRFPATAQQSREFKAAGTFEAGKSSGRKQNGTRL